MLIVQQGPVVQDQEPGDSGACPRNLGTGPYVQSSYSSQLVKYTANPHYWGGKPAAPEVNVAYYATNTAAATALADGQLTWAGNDIANVNSIFVDKDKKTNHTYFAPGSTVTLWFNTPSSWSADRPGRSPSHQRRHRPHGAVRGGRVGLRDSRRRPPVDSSLPVQAAYLESSLKNDLSATANATKVASLLTGDGYTKDSTGFYSKGGQQITFSIEDPTAYSDYYADIQLDSPGTSG